VHPPTNRLAIISLCAALLTIGLFCLGLLPIPFTDLASYTLSALSGLVAFISGMIALLQIRRRKEGGAILAWTGTVMGFLTMLAALCLVVLVLSLFPLVLGWLEQLWKQVKPSL
jgi:hypothetical protein